VKRGRHEGGITKRYSRDGQLIGYQVQVRLPGGRRKTVGTAPSMKEARLIAQQAQVELASGRLNGDRRQKLDDYLQAWIASKAPGLAVKSTESYDLNRRRVAPLIGAIRLDALQPSHIQQAYGDLSRQGLSPLSVRQVHRLLHAAVQDAVRLGLVPVNPLDAVTAPRAPYREMNTLSIDEVRELFRATRSDRLHPLWVVLVTTGLRLGEALALRWEDIDLERGSLSVHRALQRQNGQGLVIVDPKSASSRRTVELTQIAINALRSYRDSWEERRELLGSEWRGTSTVFASDVGTALDPTNVGHRFGRAIKAAGLRRVRVHDLRHTAATLALQQGVNPKVVQEMLGHSSIMLTLGTYSHVVQPIRREAADRMNKLFGSESRSAPDKSGEGEEVQ
jgi:integrase